jgi:hypothetical protein
VPEQPALTLRELNRATLARQLLLERASIPVPAAIERLVGLQAQLPMPPYVGLWTRLNDFTRDRLALLIEARQVVRATLMRATLHLFTADDYLRFRGTLQPALEGASEDILKRRNAEFDPQDILAEARRYIGETPRTFAEITAHFGELMPNTDPGSIRYTIRTRLPMMQVPIAGGWSYPGTPRFTLAESWLGQPIPTEDHLRALIRRYLAAFGPAGVTDMQTWSGLGKLRAVFEEMKPELRVYRDEGRRDLFDLPDAPLPDADTPAPIRFLPEFDNLLLSHSNRTRVIADEYRKAVYLPGLRVAATFLMDGFVAGVWKVERKKGDAALLLQPFAPLSAPDRATLTEEAEQLLRFIESDAKTYAVRVEA